VGKNKRVHGRAGCARTGSIGGRRARERGAVLQHLLTLAYAHDL
jgi:hypothetical protein